MPFACTSPYNKSNATKFQRKESCTSSKIGPYSSRAPCVYECFEGGDGRKKTLAAAAARLQKSFKNKKLKANLSKRLAEARARLSSKKGGRKKTGCPAKSRSDCTSPCKWASGTKRSFCRKGKNSKSKTKKRRCKYGVNSKNSKCFTKKQFFSRVKKSSGKLSQKSRLAKALASRLKTGVHELV